MFVIGPYHNISESCLFGSHKLYTIDCTWPFDLTLLNSSMIHEYVIITLIFYVVAVQMKAPSTIKTNIKAASSSHPYSRP